MPAYIVALDATKSGKTLIDDIDAMLVVATDPAEAVQLAQASFTGTHASQASKMWASATATLINAAGADAVLNKFKQK